jgi:hypothetical protein
MLLDQSLLRSVVKAVPTLPIGAIAPDLDFSEPHRAVTRGVAIV